MTQLSLRDKVLVELAESVVALDETRAVAAAEKALHEGIDAYDAIQEGLLAGMNKAGKLFEE
jgi:methanogenic corrinoid protein MtbC1